MNKFWRLLVFIGIVLICLSFSLLVYNKYIDERAGVKSKDVYLKIQKSFDDEEKYISIGDENTEMKVVNVDGYDYIGIINIPVLGLELPIMSDWDYEKMKISPGRYYGSVFTDDLVICAHSYENLFGNIEDLNPGDKLVLTDMNQNEYIYEVQVLEVLSSKDVKKMIESEFDLTLYTCTNNNLDRITVRLNRI